MASHAALHVVFDGTCAAELGRSEGCHLHRVARQFESGLEAEVPVDKADLSASCNHVGHGCGWWTVAAVALNGMVVVGLAHLQRPHSPFKSKYPRPLCQFGPSYLMLPQHRATGAVRRTIMCMECSMDRSITDRRAPLLTSFRRMCCPAWPS